MVDPVSGLNTVVAIGGIHIALFGVISHWNHSISKRQPPHIVLNERAGELQRATRLSVCVFAKILCSSQIIMRKGVRTNMEFPSREWMKRIPWLRVTDLVTACSNCAAATVGDLYRIKCTNAVYESK